MGQGWLGGSLYLKDSSGGVALCKMGYFVAPSLAAAKKVLVKMFELQKSFLAAIGQPRSLNETNIGRRCFFVEKKISHRSNGKQT